MNRRDKVAQLIRTVTGKDALPTDEESLFDAGVLDSFALTDVVAGIEKEFGIRVPDGDVTPRKFDSIERIDSYLADQGA
jgi:acyl carrier protein